MFWIFLNKQIYLLFYEASNIQNTKRLEMSVPMMTEDVCLNNTL